MKKTRHTEVNRTGIALSPVQAKELLEGARHAEPSMLGDEKAIDAVRASYGSGAEPIGTVPPPTTAKGAAGRVASAVKGASLAVLIDKIGARLAFERTGTRLYGALISKHDPALALAGGPGVEELERFRSEEHAHFRMLQETLVALGGDPTAVTPSADVAAVLSMGLPQVLLDARTDFSQCLEAILIAELADHDGWEVLIDLARALGKDDLAERFGQALAEEEVHLRRVREWVKAATLAKAGRPGRAEEATR